MCLVDLGTEATAMRKMGVETRGKEIMKNIPTGSQVKILKRGFCFHIFD